MSPIVRIADPRGSTPRPLSLFAVALGCTALGLLLFGFVVTFGSTAMGTAIMAMGQRENEDEPPRGTPRLVAQPVRRIHNTE